MPPRKGIVKSGNAGNSSKVGKTRSAPEIPKEKPLFPPGSKTPASLLNERCQKLGWERPFIDTYSQKEGFSFSVVLSRINKKTNEKESVRFRPRIPYLRPSAVEARHWGATYALYRCFNNMQLQFALPPGPKEYWNELATEHKQALPKDQWLYAQDPFAAQEWEKAKQHKPIEQSPGPSNDRRSGHVINEFSNAPEVRMSMALRELTEASIKRGFSLYPEAHHPEPAILTEENRLLVLKQLASLGFTSTQIKSTLDDFSKPSALVTRLLSISSPLDACIEYLVLHVPECDLPDRFLPSSNSSNPFITSAHSGSDNLKRRWIEEKAMKEAGWPAHTIKDLTIDPVLVDNWSLLTFALGQRLIGKDWIATLSESANHPPFNIDYEEAEALGITLSESYLTMPLFTAPVEVNISKSSDQRYPRPGFCPIYLTSKSVPPYIRLHLISKLLLSMEEADFLQPGESFLFALMRILEAEWAEVEDKGPPEVSTVLKHLMPQKVALPSQEMAPSFSVRQEPLYHSKQLRGSSATSQQIKAEFEVLCRSKKYAEMLSVREKLPAYQCKDEFLRLLEKKRALVVVGETGSGKTTQLPQFVLDSMIQSGNGSKTCILVTQPRRISAISVASRVSAERVDDGSVGYVIRGESKQTYKTKLLFCTTGVVLRRLSVGDRLAGVSHVIVDEVHERSVDGDILLLELKELLETHPSLKVILMSATINHELFVRYFNNAPLLPIPGFTHPVTDKYLEDYLPLINYDGPMTGSTRQGSDVQKSFRYKYRDLDEKGVASLEGVVFSGRIDFQLIGAVVEYILSSQQDPVGILIFLPGVQEIRQCIEAVKAALCKENHYDVFPLHANLSSDEQKAVFKKTKGWKIVAATNIAETSITIDDVVYVIDSGKVKENIYDQDTGISRLIETWVTEAAAKQRRGRAGRTQPGVCYKLYTRQQSDDMRKHPIPEILRVPLESIILRAKMARESDDPKNYLMKAINPPKLEAIESAHKALINLGAIELSGQLTALGRHMATLPMDLRLGKMLVLGAIFRCLDPVLTITSIMSSKPLFLSPVEKREEANIARVRFSYGSSDLLTDLNAFNECSKLRAEGRSHSSIRGFCEQNFLSMASIRDVNTLRGELFSSLTGLGFVPRNCSPSSPILNKNSENLNLIKAIILGGLWPQVANIRLPSSAIKFDKVQAGTVQRENTAREYKIFDISDGRVFLHPSSILFSENSWKSPFLVYFHKYQSTKVFLRDATEVPLFALLLFGGAVTIDQVKGGLTFQGEGYKIKLRAWPRIGILVNHLRRLLDAQLERCIEEGMLFAHSDSDNPVMDAILALLERDGLTE